MSPVVSKEIARSIAGALKVVFHQLGLPVEVSLALDTASKSISAGASHLAKDHSHFSEMTLAPSVKVICLVRVSRI